MKGAFEPLAAVILVLVCVVPVQAQDPLLPLRTNTPPVLDGVLDDPVWQKAPHVQGFKTYSPDYGIDMPDETVVYYAYDRENLYFAFRCFDSEPDKIKTSTTSRDNIRPEDWICINLDSFNDQQGLYAFYVNPYGIQGDSRFASGREDDGVDMVWYSKGRVDEQGYAIEVQIPFKSIRFANKNPVEMGVIFERRVSRRSEQGTYPPLSPDRGMFFLTQMKPVLFRDIKHYTLFELLPAVTYSRRSTLEQNALTSVGDNRDLSLTTKFGITSDLILDGTLNPDFSQVESDAGQIEVNQRFALFFPEKRPFFLEGSDYFNFSGASNGDPLVSVVHTRRIVNPMAGVKLSGKLGKKNTVASIIARDELSTDGLSGVPTGANQAGHANFAIFRYKRSLNDDSYLGAFYTGRERNRGYNRLVGMDGQIRINESSLLGYSFFASQTKADEISAKDNGHALGLDYVYTTRNLSLGFGLQDLSTDFQTETGFVTRTGVTLLRASAGPKFYPQSRFIRRIDPSFSTIQTKDKLSDLYETSNALALRFIFWGNSNVTAGYTYSNEIFLGQRFNTAGWQISGGSQLTRGLTFSLSYRNGKSIRYVEEPYQGRGNTASASLTYHPSDKLSTNVAISYSDFFRDSNSQKIFDVSIVRTRVTYQLNKYLFFRGIVEHDSYRKRLLTDFLASFTYIPGTVLHFGYGSLYEKIRWENGNYVDSNRFRETQRGFFTKASYLWRL